MRQLLSTEDLEWIRDSALHYYALAVTDVWYGIYWNWKYMKPCFSSSRLGLFSRAKAVVVYDQLINNDKRMGDNLLLVEDNLLFRF